MLGIITTCILLSVVILIVYVCITVPTVLLIVGFIAAILGLIGLIFMWSTVDKKDKGSK